MHIKFNTQHVHGKTSMRHNMARAASMFKAPATAREAMEQSSKTSHFVAATSYLTALSLATAAGVLLHAHPVEANELGKQVFNNNCAACHMGGKNAVINEKTLDKEALEKYLAGGFKLESIIYQVQNGKGAMPAWDAVLDEDEIEAVSKYVFDTATAGTWGSQ